MFKTFLSLVILVLISSSSAHSEEEINSLEDIYFEDLQNIKEELDVLIAPEDREGFYETYDLLKGLDIGKLIANILSGVHDNKTCHLCQEGLTLGKQLLQTPELVKTLGKSLCKSVKGFTERVCDGLIERNADPMVYIIHHSKLTIPEMCSVLLHPECMKHLEIPMTKQVEWELPLTPKSERRQFRPQPRDDKPLKMLQLTDVHMDLWYSPGSNAHCNEPVCCRSTSYGNNYSAGYWAETYSNCDVPLDLVQSALNHIKDTHKDIDLVIWTGDNIPHDVWNTTQEVNLLHVKTMTDVIKEAFNGTKVHPILGNHEAHPINMYVPIQVTEDKSNNFSMSWLYETLGDDYWEQYLDTESAKKTFKRGGYYTTMIKDNLKLIAINNNHAYLDNFWRLYDPVDPDSQLQFLIDELDSAEKKNIYAMIIGHIPPTDAYIAWRYNYIRIAERYDHLIVGTYWGHTHKDEIFVLYNKNQKNELIPVSHGYIGPSLTTASNLNPAYRVYTLDGNGRPLDFDTYYTNVTDDNLKGAQHQPQWKKGFSAKESYELKSLSTESWDQFMTRAQTDDKMTELYFKHYYRFSEAFEEANNMSISSQRRALESRRVQNPVYSHIKN